MFHTLEWLLALQQTYGYRPVAYVDALPGEEIRSGQAFCSVNSWLTGRRLVSVPFSDHVAFLLESTEDLQKLLEQVKAGVDRKEVRYVEIRPTPPAYVDLAGYKDHDTFVLHRIDLRQELSALFRNFHKDCVQRKIKRAEREGLSYAEGRGNELVDQFYGLLLKTNSRRGTPPQPKRWFRNLAACMGDRLKIRVASKGDLPVAAILTLSFRKTITYKYGCSDERYHNLGGMPFLFWRSMQDAKVNRMETFDLGRSDIDHTGLIAFKEHLGAQKEVLRYWKYPGTVGLKRNSRNFKAASALLSFAPQIVLRVTGSVLYRHMA